MARPLEKLDELQRDLQAIWLRMSDIALRRGLLDCRAALRTAAGDQAAELHLAVSLILSRQGRSDEALEEIDSALNFEPESTVLWGNKGWYLLCSGQPERALKTMLHATDLERERAWTNPFLLTNLAEALWACGRQDDANAIFDRAIQAADLAVVDHVYRLADTGAELRRFHFAVEMFARFLALRLGRLDADTPPLEVIESVSEGDFQKIELRDGLLNAITYMTALRDAMTADIPLAGAGEASAELDAERERVRAEMEPLWKRALAGARQ